MHYVIITGQHSWETLIFIPTEKFWGPANPPDGGANFEKFSDSSRKFWSVPLLLISRSDSLVIKKPVKNTFSMYFVYIFVEKRCENMLGVIPVCFLAFQTLKNCIQYSIWILRKLWKNPDGNISWKITCHDIWLSVKSFKKIKIKPGAF